MKSSKKPLTKFSEKLSRILFIALPAVLFFSYHPVISLGENALMNFELSLPEIWLLLFFLAALPQLPALFKYFGAKKLALSAAVPLYFSLSVLWSGNRPRTVLTAGILWLLVYAALNLTYMLHQQKSLKAAMLKSLLISALLVSIFCWLQCILDLSGLAREYTLMCEGCVSSAFGFPHPNGFAIEPQFMGNLLLAPVLLCFYLLSAPAYFKQKRKSQKILMIALTLFLSMTLFLTFSRGAIYAFAVGLMIEQIMLYRKNIKRILAALGLALAAFVLTLTLQGVFSAVSPTSDAFSSGITKAIHHLSLGKIDLRSEEIKSLAAETAETTEPAETEEPTESSEAADATAEDSASKFSGYVAESTDIRLNLNRLAVDTWKSSPKYLLIGAGLGSAGPAMHAYAPESLGEKEIVQNEYFSLLLETGLLGCLLVTAIIICTIKATKPCKNPLLASLLLSFALTLLFFSGLPNALHIYLLPVLFASIGLRA